ncbi:ElyC/SanA/YdcF family protein [Marinomonas gallaica]|uniref:ElyC/SanA/YdcF family protein n=1 Tax=Marinomonas gallaica TaxID=1806667 RepID=UPI003CE4EA9D
MKDCTPVMTNPHAPLHILFLGYDQSQTRLIDLLISHQCRVDHTQEPVAQLKGYDLVVSFGYRHLLSAEVIEQADCPIINLHIAYLPFNKGAHPNFWSFYEGTPSGVSIHLIDQSIDTGQLLYQQKLHFDTSNESFASTYEALSDAIESLFETHIHDILMHRFPVTTQRPYGTFHNQGELPEGVNWSHNIEQTIQALKARSSKKAVLVLSNLMDDDEIINHETQQRCLEAIRLFRQERLDYMITSGWIYDARFSISLSEATARFLRVNGVKSNCILQNRASRDTVGDALFTRLHLLARHNIQELTVVTSDYHLHRTRIIFQQLLPSNVTLHFIGCTTPHADYQAKEKASLNRFLETFSGVDQDDLDALLSSLVTKHALYKETAQ